MLGGHTGSFAIDTIGISTIFPRNLMFFTLPVVAPPPRYPGGERAKEITSPDFMVTVLLEEPQLLTSGVKDNDAVETPLIIQIRVVVLYDGLNISAAIVIVDPSTSPGGTVTVGILVNVG